MLSVTDLSVMFSTKKLFENVNLKFKNGNCYGVIGANGAGKSTFLKVISRQMDPNTGVVHIDANERISVLEQDHFKYNDETILNTVLSGYEKLYKNVLDREAIYSKGDFTEEDGIISGQLEEEFMDMNGWESESEVEKLLKGLNIDCTDIYEKMDNIKSSDKVKVLLARALFGNPDILILDEPTNNLDFASIKWLEEYLIEFEKTVIVVSHDRHFLNTVCTHTVDIDFGEAKIYFGNYDFWRESSQLALELTQNANAKKEEKMKKMEEFIQRFSANASKSKQATSRKKMLDKIQLDDIKPSSRKYPYISIKPNNKCGKEILHVSELTLKENNETVFENLTFDVFGGDKVFFYSKEESIISKFFDTINQEDAPNITGEYKFGGTVEKEYFPQDIAPYFENNDHNLIEWLGEYDKTDEGEGYIRSFLGKMLFSGDEPLKEVKKLSGGEKVRMYFSKIMLLAPNTLILDQPTNHLDLESIQSVNEGLISYEGSVLFTSHDLSFAETISNKVIEIGPKGALVYEGTFNEYLEDENMISQSKDLY